MRKLEEQVEQRLLTRSPSGVGLTSDGHALFEAISGHFDALDTTLSPFDDFEHGIVRIASGPCFLSSWLLPRLPRFVAAYPHIELKIQSHASTCDFATKPADVALRYGLGDWQGLYIEKMFNEWIVPLIASDLLNGMKTIDRCDLSLWPVLGDPIDDNRRWREWCASFGLSLPTRFVTQFDTVDALRHAISEGLGVGLGRLVSSSHSVSSGRLVVFSENYLPVKEAYYLVYPPQLKRHRGVQMFRKWLSDETEIYRRSITRFTQPPA